MAGYTPAFFGNGIAVGSGGNVTTQVHTEFGPRNTGGNVGPLLTDGSNQELVLDIRGDTFASIGEQIGLVATYLPAGAVIRRAVVQVKTPFTMTGTSPTVLIGTYGSEVTNGIVLTSAQVHAAGYYDVTATQTGTWAAATPLDARTQIGMALGGTTPTLTSVGEMRITLSYETIGTSTV